MADWFSFQFLGIANTLRKFEEVDRAVDRATMWTLREAGRQVKRRAKSAAPKDTGTLRNSIGSSKKLRKIPGGYALKVWPHGPVAHKYAAKEENRQPYMTPASQAMQQQITVIGAKAYGRAARRL